MNRARLLAVAMFLTPLAAMGCAAILGLDDPRVEQHDASTGIDGSTGEGGSPDASDGGANDGWRLPDVTFTFSDFTDKQNWTAYNLQDISPNAVSYGGGAFDGQRWLYFSPSENAANTQASSQIPLLRFDTTKDFANKNSWESYDPRTVNSKAKGFGGAVYTFPATGKGHVYYVPFEGSDGLRTGLVLRFDTNAAAFNGTSAVTGESALLAKDLEELFPEAGTIGYFGAVYDGTRYAYFVPGLGGSRMALKLDTTQDFRLASAWEVFDTTRISPADETRGFVGGVFDGQYLYFVPYGRGGFTTGLAVRLDTKKTFSDPSSWELADMSIILGNNARGFQMGGFDGQYVYYVPTFDDVTYHGRVVRFDTKSATFATNSGDGGTHGWEMFDMVMGGPPIDEAGAPVDDGGNPIDGGIPGLPTGSPFDPRGYSGAAFDGRYMYFVPSYRNPIYAGEIDYHGLVAQYDTSKPFKDPSSWKFFDAAQLAPTPPLSPEAGVNATKPGGFFGAMFDGAYVYFAPSFGPLVVRYLARTPKKDESYPPLSHPSRGSFF